MKKILMVLCVSLLCILLSACGSANPTVVENNKTSIDISELNLTEFIWSGIDIKSGEEYILCFDDNNYELTVKTNGETGKYTGTYSINEDGLKLNGLTVLEKPDNVSIIVDGDKSYIDLDGHKLSIDDSKTVEEAAEKLGLAEELKTILSSGYCWIACSNGQALVLYVNGEESSLKTVASLGEGKVAVQDLKGAWSLNGNSLDIYSQTNTIPSDYKWELLQEDDISCIKLVSDGNEAFFYQTQVTNVEEAVELANQYIINQTTVDNIEDITHFLDGYEGVSIVDGLIYAGLDPSYDNRSILAEKADIKKYKGTAEQNLFLIEYMGGIVK